MDDSKSVVRNFRCAPATWEAVEKKSAELAISKGKFVELAIRRALGERVGERFDALGKTFT